MRTEKPSQLRTSFGTGETKIASARLKRFFSIGAEISQEKRDV